MDNKYIVQQTTGMDTSHSYFVNEISVWTGVRSTKIGHLTSGIEWSL